MALLESTCERPVFFIQGDQHYGKTWLLQWFQTELGATSSLATVDLAIKLTEPKIILSSFAALLGKSKFAKFSARARQMGATGSAVIKDVEIVGDNNVVSATAPGETAEDKLFAAMELTGEFVEDLKRLSYSRPIILVLDGYDQNVASISSWLTRSLIPGIDPIAHARLIVAGRDLPALPPKFASRCTTIRLQGVRKAADWLEVVELANRKCPLHEGGGDAASYLHGMIDATRGVPGTIMPLILGFPEKAAK